MQIVLLLVLAGLVTLPCLVACTQVGPYRTDQSTLLVQPVNPTSHEPTIDERHKLIDEPFEGLAVKLGFVEFDEFGHLFNRNQMNDLLTQIKQLKDPLIIVFVHGWHNNAAPGNGNITSFANQTLLHAAQIEKNDRGDHARPVVGVYVGWRGESIDSNKLALASMLTFWDRKNTAHSVGNGDVVELFLRLNQYRYHKGNENSRLVYIGHSFGGAVTYSALMHTIVEHLADENMAHPIGDLVVLVNPAFEAMRFRPLSDLSKARNYDPDQRPILAIITTEADSATRYAFPAGRYVSTLFDTYADKQSPGMNTTAIGHYLPFITHVLTVATPKNSPSCFSQTQGAVSSARVLSTFMDWHRQSTHENSYCFNDAQLMYANAEPTLLTRCDSMGECIAAAGDQFIAKGAVDKGFAPVNNPIMNIRTTGEIMSGHNDIWNPTIQGFLTQLVAISIADPSAVPMFSIKAQ